MAAGNERHKTQSGSADGRFSQILVRTSHKEVTVRRSSGVTGGDAPKSASIQNKISKKRIMHPAMGSGLL